MNLFSASLNFLQSIRPKATTVRFEARATALVSDITAAADEAYARAQGLTILAAEILTHGQLERRFATESNALAGRLEKALEAK